MQWSKLKTRAKAFIVPPLRKRIDFHVTSYRQSHDEAEKAWITVDGEQVFVASWYRHQYAGAKRKQKGTLARDARGRLIRDPALPEWITAPEQIELHRPQQFGEALREYLDMPIAEALRSADPFIRAMSMVDRRLGRNKVPALRPQDDDHTLVRLFFELRMKSGQ